ncbi:hypothetical protein EW026_g1085 [Hermanssonia centrifuga]|uniref:Uncharacterized protein n=1 Tax=Hermanssonia centrifuga TaxID=98765 RepID=A0A4S4KUD8_9APHY|nr:hypothetical protein EW026_g1085 [Hermanssonia centrifuga]
MALSFIGKPISLISHSDVRYRGILAGIDPAASTIQLSNVYSMGTESRRPPEQFIPPVQEPYAYIIFRASEVKDLAVDEPQPRRSVHDDPAVLGWGRVTYSQVGWRNISKFTDELDIQASAPVAPGSFPYNAAGNYPQTPGSALPPQAQTAASPQRPQAYAQVAAPQGSPAQSTAGPAVQNGATPSPVVVPAGAAKGTRSNPIHSATASMETVERALGDLRVPNGEAPAPAARGGHGGRRGGRHHDAKPVPVPTTDFDFQSSNARFDKSALGPNNRVIPKSEEPDAVADGEEAEDGDAKEKGKEKPENPSAYNPKKSFFDSLTPGSNGPPSENRGRGGGRRGGGRNRREEERERNVATFGEPGGIGLMGPGAYVGGWGGYGRRGGGRGRRGSGIPAGGRQ